MTPSAPHRFGTQARVRAIEEENSAKIERIEIVQEKMQEKLDQVLEMMANLVKEKGAADSPSSQEGSIPQEAGHGREDLPSPLGFTPPQAHTSHGTHVPIIQPAERYIYTYTLPSNGQPTVQEPHSEASPTNPVLVPDLDNPKAQEESKKDSTEQTDSTEAQQKIDLLEERMKAMEGISTRGVTNATELSLVSGLVIPPKFKTPDFVKYNEDSCPSTHITMYCRKMAGYTSNEKLLIHCFQDSLSGSAACWYVRLTCLNVKTWRDLADAFLAQYKDIMDTVSDRVSL